MFSFLSFQTCIQCKHDTLNLCLPREPFAFSSCIDFAILFPLIYSAWLNHFNSFCIHYIPLTLNPVLTCLTAQIVYASLFPAFRVLWCSWWASQLSVPYKKVGKSTLLYSHFFLLCDIQLSTNPHPSFYQHFNTLTFQYASANFSTHFTMSYGQLSLWWGDQAAARSKEYL